MDIVCGCAKEDPRTNPRCIQYYQLYKLLFSLGANLTFTDIRISKKNVHRTIFDNETINLYGGQYYVFGN